jgi:hypothetical protein
MTFKLIASYRALRAAECKREGAIKPFLVADAPEFRAGIDHTAALGQ